MGLPTSASHPNLHPPELGLSMHVDIPRTLAFTLVAVTVTCNRQSAQLRLIIVTFILKNFNRFLNNQLRERS